MAKSQQVILGGQHICLELLTALKLFPLIHLQDLTNYKYNKMVNRSLALLNKFYSAKSRMFKMAVQAMVRVF